MGGFKDFREIGAWQRSRELKLLAYQVAKRAEAAHDFKFRDQLLDCSRSAPRNIAEGFARFKHKEFAQFVRVAKGSVAEVLDHFIDAVDSGYLTAEQFPRHEHACKKALMAINGLLRHLETTPDPKGPWKKRAAP
jgi:four helix bundle protein